MTSTRSTKAGRDLMTRLGRASHDIAITCSEIARLTKQYTGAQEELCSGPRYTWSGNHSWEWTQEWQDQLEAKSDRLEQRITAAVAQLGEGYSVTFDGDPRGACVYIKTPDNRSDDWGGRGICARLV